MMRALILRLDGAVRAATHRLHRFLHWTRTPKAARITRMLAVLAASPGVVVALPLYASIPLLLALVVLAVRQDDGPSTEAALAALLRLILLIMAGGAALLFLITPGIMLGSIATASTLSVLGEYMADEPH